jgi:hypothetical protein
VGHGLPIMCIEGLKLLLERLGRHAGCGVHYGSSLSSYHSGAEML